MIHYVSSNIFPLPTRPFVLVHVVNNRGAWGAGFTSSISRNLPKAEEDYRRWTDRALGKIMISQLGGEKFVAHLCAQNGLYSAKANPKPIQYNHLEACLETLSLWVSAQEDPPPSIIMPRIGCGLARGNWETVSAIIEDRLAEWDVFVYSL